MTPTRLAESSETGKATCRRREDHEPLRANPIGSSTASAIAHQQILTADRDDEQERVADDEHDIAQHRAVDHEAGRGGDLADEEPGRHALGGRLFPLRLSLATHRRDQHGSRDPSDRIRTHGRRHGRAWPRAAQRSRRDGSDDADFSVAFFDMDVTTRAPWKSAKSVASHPRRYGAQSQYLVGHRAHRSDARPRPRETSLLHERIFVAWGPLCSSPTANASSTRIACSTARPSRPAQSTW